jgi:diaminopimelate decarboxylase
VSVIAGPAELPLTARLEQWQRSLLARPALLQELLEQYGSPLNLIAPEPMAANLAELETAARGRGLGFRAYFARKANKSLALVDRALELGAGVDVASEQELAQTLGRGAVGADIVLTAAIKSRRLLELCAGTHVSCVIDNADELALAREVAATSGHELPVGFRLAVSGAAADRPPTRFGLGAAEIRELAGRVDWGHNGGAGLRLDGIHFHVDGYAPDDRARGIREALELVDALTESGHCPRWIDIGGGIPMRYLSDPGEWASFWQAQRSALRGERPPLTYLGHGLGLREQNGEVVGEPNVYPAAQSLVRGTWLDAVLHSPAGSAGGGTIAAAIALRGLELRCEPGRSLLDGCGMTVARVAFRKRGAGGDDLIGLEMNRTQMRSTADDAMIDPLLVRGPGSGEPSAPLDGYLVGAYCIERELISWRRQRFPEGVAVGDLLAFPNTAGYFMHILESSSHQMPLARNLVIRGGEPAGLDPIDL